MKQSIFTQEWETMGSASTVKGKIVVMMNYTTKTVSGTHSVTHDDYSKQVPVHKMETYINGNLWWSSSALESEHIVLSEVERCKRQMQQQMDRLANSEPVKTFADKMKELGF